MLRNKSRMHWEILRSSCSAMGIRSHSIQVPRLQRICRLWRRRSVQCLSFGTRLTGRLYCTPKAMWKLRWFLRDFGYDAYLLGKNKIDDKALIDIWGVVTVSEVTIHGISVLNFDGFAPAARWEELSVFTDIEPGGSVSLLEKGSAAVRRTGS